MSIQNSGWSRLFAGAAISALLAATVVGAIQHVEQSKRRAAFLALPAAQRVRDLMLVRDALEAYESKHGAYPKSEGFDGLFTCWGKSTPDWIPGLVPEFLPALPRDPRGNNACNQQYIYQSNGDTFKLLSISPDDCIAVKEVFPEMIDPFRGCNAYGFWSMSAAYQ